MEPLERFLCAARMEEPDEVPVSLLTSARLFSRLYGIKVFQFFHDPKMMLDAILHTMKRFPDIVLFPGLWADYGIVVEPSAFGSRIYWPENFVPYVKGELFKNPEDIRGLEPPDPKTDGLMPFVLESIGTFKNMHPRSSSTFMPSPEVPFRLPPTCEAPQNF